MPDAEQVATALAYEFLRRGNYSASSGPVEVPRLLEVAAAADVAEAEAEFQHVPEFASLAVQSVGFEDGVDEPKSAHLSHPRFGTHDQGITGRNRRRSTAYA